MTRSTKPLGSPHKRSRPPEYVERMRHPNPGKATITAIELAIPAGSAIVRLVQQLGGAAGTALLGRRER